MKTAVPCALCGRVFEPDDLMVGVKTGRGTRVICLSDAIDGARAQAPAGLSCVLIVAGGVLRIVDNRVKP